MTCNFIYKNGERCQNDCSKNSKFCNKHKYYGKYKYNDHDSEPMEETPPISNNVIQQGPNYIQDNSYNRYFIKSIIDSKPDASSVATAPKSSSYSDYLPILMMFLPLLKNILGTQEVLNLFKNFKNLNGIKENNKNDNNIKTTDGSDVVPIISTASEEIPDLPNRNPATNIKKSEG